MTNARVLSNVLLNFKTNAAQQWANKLEKLFTSWSSGDDGSESNVRKHCVRQLGSLIKNVNLNESKDLQRSVLRFFFLHAYFNVTSVSKDIDHVSVLMIFINI